MEKELRAEITPKSVPDIFRHIFKLLYLTVTCELHLQHLSLCIIPCGSDLRISQYVPSHCLLFSLSVSAFVIPDRNVLYYNAFIYISFLKEFPLILPREDFVPPTMTIAAYFIFPFVLPLCRC